MWGWAATFRETMGFHHNSPPLPPSPSPSVREVIWLHANWITCPHICSPSHASHVGQSTFHCQWYKTLSLSMESNAVDRYIAQDLGLTAGLGPSQLLILNQPRRCWVPEYTKHSPAAFNKVIYDVQLTIFLLFQSPFSIFITADCCTCALQKLTFASQGIHSLFYFKRRHSMVISIPWPP